MRMAEASLHVPRRVRIAAHLAALGPVPSSLWRLPLIFGFSMGMPTVFMVEVMSEPWWMRVLYLVGLGLVSDLAAVLTLGLIKRWGEVFPSWVPVVSGSPVPVWVVLMLVIPGGTVVALYSVLMLARAGENLAGMSEPWRLLIVAAYAPVLLWAPCLAIVTTNYLRRRRRMAQLGVARLGMVRR